jgi:hypothetical protein
VKIALLNGYHKALYCINDVCATKLCWYSVLIVHLNLLRFCCCLLHRKSLHKRLRQSEIILRIQRPSKKKFPDCDREQQGSESALRKSNSALQLENDCFCVLLILLLSESEWARGQNMLTSTMQESFNSAQKKAA